MGISVERIERVQEELFERLESDLEIANKSDYYLTGRDIYQYTVAIKNLEDMKKNAKEERE